MNQDTTSNEQCFSIVEIFKKSFRNNHAFAGYTHAVSGLFAVALIALAGAYFGWGIPFLASVPLIAVTIGFSIALIGATLVPDLDNTQSTSRSTFGILGVILTTIFRASSTIIQTFVRTRKDDSTPDPHRGFWHSTVGAAVLGGIVWGLSTFPQEFSIPLIGTVTLGWLISFLIFGGMMHLMLAVFAKSSMKSIKKNPLVGELLAFVVSLVMSLSIFWFVPKDDFLWLGVAVAVGCFVHILGDTFTRAGTPLFFPIVGIVKGKMWWKTRFARLESGSDFEKVISAILTVAAVIALIAAIVIVL